MISNEANNILDLTGRLRNFPSLRDLLPSSLLKGIDFFSDVDAALLDEISGSVSISEFNTGDIICRHGKYDEKFHVLLSGKVTAVIPTPDNPKYELFSLGPGDFFGEEIVFSSEPRENTVIAREKTTTVSLGAEILKPLIKRSSKIMTIMNRLYIDRKLKSDLRSVPIFTKLNPDLFQEVLSRAELLSLPEDRIIFNEGDPGDSFYLIREGEVKVFRHHENEEKLIAILTDGQFFGEMSLMTDERRNATVMTLSQTELVKISSENFISIVERDKDMMAELVVVVRDRTGQQADALRNPEIAVATRRVLELNRDVNRHLDILSQCMVDTEHGSALLATMLGSRYPYVYPRDSACASRFLYRLSISNLNAGETAFRHLQEISRFILKCQRKDGYWGQRYGIDLSDKGIYRQEDNVAHGVIILSRYLLAAKKRNREIPSLDRYLDAISRASEFARRNYYRNELHLFYSTTSIHESAIERGYTIWVNYAYLLMLRLIERLSREFSIGERFR
ncbi:MAG: cyclic nucleotide-binding domain-containing protein, partial [Spirochaetes bacterium]|nr:cyclic nucleotide-binding domain-containing protein [Spirochaetota bacterium]